MEKKIITSNYTEAINRLKEASSNSRVIRKTRYDAFSTDKLLNSQAIKHHRQSSQIIGNQCL